MNKIHLLQFEQQFVFIWFLQQDTGQELNTIKVYAVAHSIEAARRQVMSVPRLALTIRHLVEQTEPLVCKTPFAEVNISANGKVATMIQGERAG